MSENAAYPASVWATFQAAPRAGEPEDPRLWASAEAHDPLTKTRVRFYVRVAHGEIADVRYRVRGCPFTVTAAASIAQGVLGRRVAEARVEPRRLLAELSAPVTKLGRVLVVEEAFRKGLQAACLKA